MSVELGKQNAISKEMIGRFATDFRNNKQYRTMMNAVKKNGVNGA